MTKINDILQEFKAKLSKLFDLGIRGKRKKVGFRIESLMFDL